MEASLLEPLWGKNGMHSRVGVLVSLLISCPVTLCSYKLTNVDEGNPCTAFMGAMDQRRLSQSPSCHGVPVCLLLPWTVQHSVFFPTDFAEYPKEYCFGEMVVVTNISYFYYLVIILVKDVYKGSSDHSLLPTRSGYKAFGSRSSNSYF